MEIIGSNLIRLESWDKVTGRVKYVDDISYPDMLYAKLLTSQYAHANIKGIDYKDAEQVKGVLCVVTGDKFKILCGTLLEDRPPIASGKVRYYGEIVAMVVATEEKIAEYALKLIKVEYQPLVEIINPYDSIKKDAPLIHENVNSYTKAVDDIYPEERSNITNRIKIRKGDIDKAWNECDVIIEEKYSLPQSDHIAMENRSSIASISQDGSVNIVSCTQSPYAVKKQISKYFNVPEGKVVVDVPLVGGAFGGKSAVFVEILAYMASYSVNGRVVKLTLPRELDMITAPCRIGLEATIKMGATASGIIKAAQITYLVDNGAYTDIAPRIAKAIATDCTGPYNIENLYCDSISVYTNHPFAVAYRGFGHDSYTFAIERTIEKLSYKLNIDSFKLRKINAIKADNLSPTQVKLTSSNIGNLDMCLDKLEKLINWQEGSKFILDNNKIISKGISCLWKTSNTFTDASSGAVITFNSDGSLNINCGVIEFGQASKTHLVQIVAQRLKMDPDRIFINYDVNTRYSPEHWKTVASMSTYLAGRALLKATDDIIAQLKKIGAVALRCSEDDLDVAGEKVFLKHDPYFNIGFINLVYGLKYPGGNTVGGQIIGRGGFNIPHLTTLDTDTGKGKTGPEWVVGAQAVEIEMDITNYDYKILKAATVLDIGKLINPNIDKGIIMGGMSMGLGLGSREQFDYINANVVNTSLRTYKMLHIGQEPEYLVDYVETPNIEAPYGARGFSEHSIIGIHAALANALTRAVDCDLDSIPIYPEKIWKTVTGDKK